MALGKSRSDDQKFQDIESSINDMKKELDKESLSGKSMKGDIDNMKKDLTQINDSIKSRSRFMKRSTNNTIRSWMEMNHRKQVMQDQAVKQRAHRSPTTRSRGPNLWTGW